MIPENTVPTPEMVGMITTIVVKVNPEREDSETRTVSVLTALTGGLSVAQEHRSYGQAKITDFLSACFSYQNFSVEAD